MRTSKYEHDNLSETSQPRTPSGDDWRVESACREADPDIFFPEDSSPESAQEAKSYCGKCTVRLMCLDFALRNDERSGIFGGLDEKERKPLAKGYAENNEQMREVRYA